MHHCRSRVETLIDFAPFAIRVQTLIPQVPKWEPNGAGEAIKHEENAQSLFCKIRVRTLIIFVRPASKGVQGRGVGGREVNLPEGF